MDIFKVAITVQENTADLIAKKFLNPLGLRISKAEKGKVTLAEMARHFRLDRILEALEGALSVEKHMTEVDVARKINLNADLRDKLQGGVGIIKVVTILVHPLIDVLNTYDMSPAKGSTSISTTV